MYCYFIDHQKEETYQSTILENSGEDQLGGQVDQNGSVENFERRHSKLSDGA